MTNIPDKIILDALKETRFAGDRIDITDIVHDAYDAGRRYKLTVTAIAFVVVAAVFVTFNVWVFAKLSCGA